MLPWSFSEEGAAEKYMAQLQHRACGNECPHLGPFGDHGRQRRWVEIAIAADSLYQHLLFTAEKKFWRCVESGEPPSVRSRAAAAPHRGRSGRRHEFVRTPGRNSLGFFAKPERPSCNTRMPRPNSRRSCPRMPRRRGGMEYGRSARNPALSASTFLKWRPNMQRSSELIGAIAGAPRQGSIRAHQSGKVADRHHTVAISPGERPDIPLCVPLERARYRPQGIGQARNRDRADHVNRQGRGAHSADHGSRSFFRGVGARQTGRYARSARRRRRIRWVPHSHMPGATPCSRWSELLGKTTSTHRTCRLARPTAHRGSAIQKG